MLVADKILSAPTWKRLEEGNILWERAERMVGGSEDELEEEEYKA
jgi:hypothetical protein